MRSQIKINLSEHPHDVMTVFVVFGRQDYGTVKKNSVIVDIGANIGTYALYAARSGARKVFAIEPNHSAFHVVERNVEDNNFQDVIVPLNLAISNADHQQVHIPKKPSPYNTIQSPDATSEAMRKGDEFDLVETITLKTLCQQHQIETIDLLKIDCEGSEFQIIPTISTDLFKKIRAIRMEYQGDNIQSLLNYICSHNFVIIKHRVDDPNAGMVWLEQINSK
jgi:FkbM family methyltransferase